MSTQIPDIKEKIGAALTYLTLGLWGLLWLLLSKMPAYSQKDFVRFHCYQSILIGLLFMFIPSGISILFTLLSQIIGIIPGGSIIVQWIHLIHSIFQQLFSYSGIALIVYCSVMGLIGKYTNIPWVSQIVNRMLR